MLPFARDFFADEAAARTVRAVARTEVGVAAGCVAFDAGSGVGALGLLFEVDAKETAPPTTRAPHAAAAPRRVSERRLIPSQCTTGLVPLGPPIG